MADDKPVWKVDLSKVRKIGEPEPISKEQEAELQRLAKEHDDLLKARIQLLDAWNHVEGALADFLSTLIETENHNISSIVYFSPHSMQTRVDMISKLVAYRTQSFHHKEAKPEWDKLAGRLRKKKGVRNLAAHGVIVGHRESGNPQVFLLAPVFQHHDAYWDAFTKKGKPGATLREVLDAINVAEKLRSDVESYHARYKVRFITI